MAGARRRPPAAISTGAADPAQHRIEGGEVRDIGAAAAADHVDPVLDDKAFEPLRQLGGAERVLGMAGDELGQPGVGLHRDQPGPVLAQPFDVLGHLARAGGAVEADHRHVEGMDDRRRGGDVGADQQGAGGLDRDLDQHRRVLVRVPRARLAPLTAALICSGSWQVSTMIASTPPAISPAHCSAQRVLQRLIADMAERGQAGPGPDRAQHKAAAAVGGELGHGLARDFGGEPVQGEGAVGEPELAQGDRRAAEAVGLDRVAAGGEVAAVDFADQVGTALADNLGAVLLAQKIALDVEVARLHLGPDGAVAQHDAVGQIVEKMSHGAAPPRPRRRRAAWRARRGDGRWRRSDRPD